jgi:SNF2 family DNA or RNA helicase
MLNFRKLRQDFSSPILKEGKGLYDKGSVLSAKVLELSPTSLKIGAQVLGNFDNTYECELEIDRAESTLIDSNCDCSYSYDCQHLGALVFHLENHLEELVVDFSKDSKGGCSEDLNETDRKELEETIKKAESKVESRRDKEFQCEVLQECLEASVTLGGSPFFLPEGEHKEDTAEVMVIFTCESKHIFDHANCPEIQLALRLPFRSKPLHVQNLKDFLDAVRYHDPILLGGKRYIFSAKSFGEEGNTLIKMLIAYTRFEEGKGEQNLRVGRLTLEAFGTILAKMYDYATTKSVMMRYRGDEDESLTMPHLFCGGIEDPLRYAKPFAQMRLELEFLDSHCPKIFLKPLVVVEQDGAIDPDQALLFECEKPGIIVKNTYYRFHPKLKRKHFRGLPAIRDLIIPEPLFGTFVENGLPELQRFAEVTNQKSLRKFVTIPFPGKVVAECRLHYLEGELEAELYFIYDRIKLPAAKSKIEFEDVNQFVKKDGIVARNLVEERLIAENLFQDFIYKEEEGLFAAKSEKKIVEFMTEVVPANQDRVKFDCPQNLLEQFIYDESTFEMHFCESKNVDSYQIHLKVKGNLKGVSVDQLWDCLSSKRAYIEIRQGEKKGKKKKESTGPTSKFLVLDLEKLAPVAQIFDDIGLSILDDNIEERPLWSLVGVSEEMFEGLPIRFSMSEGLKQVQKQMLGETELKPEAIPKAIQAKLREYQVDGVSWLERLRKMHLNGILADDMGLGKTLQAIVALTQNKANNAKSPSLVVCPTSLVYNWKEEIGKFNPDLKVLLVDGTPAHRKKILQGMKGTDVIVTSYSLLQKDIEIYQQQPFSYAILDEAQHIKNRTTRNAKSVKMIDAAHKLILTGTPIENGLAELWSLFDFLMPGLLSSYDRFVEKFLRHQEGGISQMEVLKRKVSPFILRRMKEDVVKDLPPVNHILYHCELTETQKSLYKSYAESARAELSKLVKKEGFDKVQIHVLATLTRLKQICCHPAIFAKDKAEPGDSAKFDMLIELVENLIDGNHKTVIFSQYTRMLQIMKETFEQMGIPFSYLDGSSKNRLEIVNEFNENPKIPLFLVSLKAGGTGLNLTGADTVIHYDMWWNPAVENQATDRVHRIGQSKNVSSYKLVTVNSIEEKIMELQGRKKGLVKKVVSCDDEAMAKLTWDEVLELLQT